MFERASEALFSSNPHKRRSYRALLAWTVCTILLVMGSLDHESYTWITMAFIGGEALVKFAAARTLVGASAAFAESAGSQVGAEHPESQER